MQQKETNIYNDTFRPFFGKLAALNLSIFDKDELMGEQKKLYEILIHLIPCIDRYLVNPEMQLEDAIGNKTMSDNKNISNMNISSPIKSFDNKTNYSYNNYNYTNYNQYSYCQKDIFDENKLDPNHTKQLNDFSDKIQNKLKTILNEKYYKNTEILDDVDNNIILSQPNNTNEMIKLHDSSIDLSTDDLFPIGH